jgi:hypothetical protein
MEWSPIGAPFPRLPTAKDIRALIPTADGRQLKLYVKLSSGKYLRVRDEENIDWSTLARVARPASGSCFFLRVATESPMGSPVPASQQISAVLSRSGALENLAARLAALQLELSSSLGNLFFLGPLFFG